MSRSSREQAADSPVLQLPYRAARDRTPGPYPANIWCSFQITRTGKAIDTASNTNRLPMNVSRLPGIWLTGALRVVVIVASIGTIAG